MTALVLIWGPLYALVTIVVTLVVYWVARKFTDSAWPPRIVIGLALAWPVGDIALTKLMLGYHCLGKSGTHVYRTVENVAGYFSTENGCESVCKESLIRSGFAFYRFIEARAKSITQFNLVQSPGLYRFTVEKPGHPQCKIYDEWFAQMKGLQRDKDYQNKCIATWKIDEASSQYGFEFSTYAAETFIGPVRGSGYLYRDLKTDEILAENIGVVLNSNLIWSFFMNPHVCNSSGNEVRVYDVLKPVRDGR